MEKRCDEWIPVVCQHQHNMHFTPSDANSLSSSVSSRLSAAQLNRTEKQPFEMNTQTHNSLNSLWMNDYINFYHFSSFNSLVLYIIWFGCDVSSPTHSLYVLLLILFCPKINMIINITSKVSGPWNSMKFPIFSTRFNTLFASNATYSTLAQMPGQWNHERGGVGGWFHFISIHPPSFIVFSTHSFVQRLLAWCGRETMEYGWHWHMLDDIPCGMNGRREMNCIWRYGCCFVEWMRNDGCTENNS